MHRQWGTDSRFLGSLLFASGTSLISFLNRDFYGVLLRPHASSLDPSSIYHFPVIFEIAETYLILM